MLGMKVQMVRKEKRVGGWRASSELMECRSVGARLGVLAIV